MMSCTGSACRGFWGFWKKWVSWVPGSEEDGWLSLARRSQAGGLVAGAHVMGGGDGKVSIERLCLSPYVEKPFNSKVIKSFVPELRSRKCFSCFGIPMFYVYMLWTFYVRFTYPYHGYVTYEVNTRLSGGQGLSPSNLISQEREKLFFPLFLLHSGWPTHIQIRTHTPNLTSFSTWYKKCSLLQLVLQMLLYITVLHLALISVTVTAILLPSILLEFLSFEHAFQLNLLRKPTQQRSQMIWEGKMSTPELCIASKRFFSVGTKVV